MVRVLLFLAAVMGAPLQAATSDVVETQTLSARVISVTDGVGAGMAVLQAGLDLTLAAGWKTYWRSPGEVGLPPDVSWEGSENIANVTLAYPAPTRFTAFEIENFGYGERVVFPLTVQLETPGAPARLALQANLLVCEEVCIPETVALTLDLPQGGGLDAEAGDLLSAWVAKVPSDGPMAGMALTQVHLGEEALTLTAQSETPFQAPDLFPEHGDYGAFGKPEITLADGGTTLWARMPVLSAGEGALDPTLVDGDRAATMGADLSTVPPPAPGAGQGLAMILVFAVLGGLILNVMPCVLPVLSIKLASALSARDRGPMRVRAGFLASAGGILAFFLALAAAMIALRAAGVAVGWGVQFQNPVFLAVMVGLMTLFAANLFGLFEVSVGQRAMTGMAQTEARGGWGGDFATGAFAAVMATPCSAPFLGTAVTFALTHGPAETLAVFTALGLGLALPYLVIALRPSLVERLPKPGAWMAKLRLVLGGLMMAAAMWLVTVLAGAAGWTLALAVAAVAAGMLGLLALRVRTVPLALGGLAVAAAVAVLVPPAPVAQAALGGPWQDFARDRISAEVQAGNVVFVDVTADWCLTCKVNKRLVLQEDPVRDLLAKDGTVAMRADWTRPDDAIAAYLQDNARFGIPFNAVYGPGAPEGIPLPELLTDGVVTEALTRAAQN